MEDASVETIQLDGKEYFLVDSISDTKNCYRFYSECNNLTDYYVLKNKLVDDKIHYVSVDTESEFNYALGLFYQKHMNDQFDSLK